MGMIDHGPRVKALTEISRAPRCQTTLQDGERCRRSSRYMIDARPYCTPHAKTKAMLILMEPPDPGPSDEEIWGLHGTWGTKENWTEMSRDDFIRSTYAGLRVAHKYIDGLRARIYALEHPSPPLEARDE